MEVISAGRAWVTSLTCTFGKRQALVKRRRVNFPNGPSAGLFDCCTTRPQKAAQAGSANGARTLGHGRRRGGHHHGTMAIATEYMAR